jgi:hypothetical protein
MKSVGKMKFWTFYFSHEDTKAGASGITQKIFFLAAYRAQRERFHALGTRIRG